MIKKLTPGQRHLLRLIVEGADTEGWAPVSAQVFPLARDLPDELVCLESVGEEGAGRVRLTDMGNNLMMAMIWL